MASQATLELLVEMKGDAEKGLSSLGGTLKSLGGVALGVAAGGIAAVGATLISAVGDARQARQIFAQTEAVIKSTGGAAGVSAQQVADYASSLSAASGKSLFGDDQIEQSENLLLTFTNIKGKSLEAATAMSVDLAQAMGGEPKDAAIQLGKALNDPIKGISALTRIGVTFTDEQKAQIQTMQEAGDVAGAQGVILAELNKEFGGSAEAAAKADGGWAQFTDRLGEAKEALGTALLPLLGQLAGFLNDTVAPAVEAAAAAFAAWLADPATQAGLQAIGDAITTGIGVAFDFIANTAIPALLAAWAALQPAIETVSGLFTQAGDSASGMGATIETVIQTVIALAQAYAQVVAAELQVVAQFWQAHGAEITAFAQSAWSQISEIISLAMQLIQATIVPALQAIAGFIQAHGADIQNILSGAWTVISNVIGAALTLIKGLLTAALQAIQGDWSGAWSTIQGMSASFVSQIGSAIGGFLSMIAGLFGTTLSEIASTWVSNFNNLVSITETVAGQIVGVLEALPGQMVQIGADIINGIIQGVNNAAGQLYSALSDIATDALNAAKESLGISSPSRRMAIEVGRPIIEGIVAGISMASDLLTRAMDQTGLDLSGAFQEGAVDPASGLGELLIGGLQEGMESAFGDLLSQAEDMAKQLTHTIEDAWGISSPSQVWADAVGTPLVLGILEGLQSLWPDLVAALAGMGTDLVQQAQDMAAKVSDALAGAFDATASIDRQAARNIDAVSKLAADMQSGVQNALALAKEETDKIQDPVEAAKYFKMRSSQILELAKLQQDFNAAQAAGDDAKAASLAQQINYINEAQAAEQQGAAQRASTATSGTSGLVGQIQALLDAITITDETSPAAQAAFNMLYQLLAQLNAATGAGGWSGAGSGGNGFRAGEPSPNAGGLALAGKGGATFGAGAIVINPPMGTNPQQIAQMVMDEIRRRTGGRL
jgi:phage-related protein